jgi:hypothetical protein
MPFKYYPLSPLPPSSASTVLTDDFQALLLEQGTISTDSFTIQEEYPFSNDSYVPVNVRITSAIDPLTQEKLGDDWKRLLFYEDINHLTSVGQKYYFSDNYWISINSENIKSLTASTTVRRANNVLRWMSGSSILEEPCSIDYSYKNPRNDVPKSDLITPGAYIRIYVQQNSKTNTIFENQRFLFGNPLNWTCLRVLGGGIRNFLNTKTLDNNSAQLLTLEVETGFVNTDTDDLVNGIADRYLYTVSGSSTAVSGIVISPNNGDILEGSTQIFDAHYYSGSTIISGSFIFSISGSSVPVNHYIFTPLTANTFSVTNNEIYTDNSLDILCSGSSGSRIFSVNLRGGW